MNRLLAIFAGGTAAAALAAPAFAAGNVQITIRHQMRGCHSWSVANGPWRTGLKLKVDRDTSLFFVNDDVMPHRLIQTAGPRAHLFTPNMNRLRAHATVTFGRAGVYRFTTKPGHDYKGMHEMKMGGKDNVLRLTITVA